MASYAITIIQGRLTRDPEMRYIERGDGEGIPVTNFTVAVNEGYGERESTEYIRVTAWRKLAETCAEYLVKGQEVTVFAGAPKAHGWIGEDGEPRARVELTAERVLFGPKPRNGDK